MLIWLLVLIINTISSFHGSIFSWADFLHGLENLLPFFIIFVINDILVIPFLFRHKITEYVFVTLFLLGIFTLFRFMVFDHKKDLFEPDFKRIEVSRPPVPEHSQGYPPMNGTNQRQMPDQFFIPDSNESNGLLKEGNETKEANINPPNDISNFRPDFPPERNMMDSDRRIGFPPYLFDLIIAVLMFGFDLAVVFLFKIRQKQLVVVTPITNDIQNVNEEVPINKSEKSYQNKTDKRQETTDSLFVKVDYKYVRIETDSIRYIEGMSDYMCIYITTSQKPLITNSTFRQILDSLPDNFLQIHRSYIVNMNRVLEISKGRIVMDKDIWLPIGDKYKETFDNYFRRLTVGKKDDLQKK